MAAFGRKVNVNGLQVKAIQPQFLDILRAIHPMLSTVLATGTPPPLFDSLSGQPQISETFDVDALQGRMLSRLTRHAVALNFR